MSVELPKDHEGREIPLDTEVLYDNNGVKFNVDEFKLCALPSSRTSFWTIRGVFEDEEEPCNFLPHLLHLVQPDSWKRLEEDLDRAVEDGNADDETTFHSMACAYMNRSGDMCGDCKFWNKYVRTCTHEMLKDVVSRIRKLSGEGE